jgi:hypothetical protein
LTSVQAIGSAWRGSPTDPRERPTAARAAAEEGSPFAVMKPIDQSQEE